MFGVIYTLDRSDIASLDKQEFGYDPIEVEVELVTSNNERMKEIVTCRTYVQKEEYKKIGNQFPSKFYKDVILKGADEHNLCKSYIKNVIEAFQDNGIIECGPPGFVL